MLDVLVDVVSTTLAERFMAVRAQTEHLVRPLSEADAQLQSMPDASPAKWHLAHTTWFFETFILAAADSAYQPVDSHFNYLFNSYYNGIGAQYPRHQRGLISRPSLSQVLSYRQIISERMLAFMDKARDAHASTQKWLSLIELGIQHEQQHQELLLTDIKHALYQNPIYPAYITGAPQPWLFNPCHWLQHDGGLVTIGCDDSRFSFDNEGPQHRVYLEPFEMASRLVANCEYQAFIDDDGYHKADYWLADAWAWLQKNRANSEGVREAPLYWCQQDGQWFEFTLYGLQALSPHQPVIHLSYYEAAAYAAWAAARLPTEFEWEAMTKAQGCEPMNNTITYHPVPSSHSTQTASSQLDGAFDCAWQWTSSHYGAYPGFQPFSGVAGEYNGKFMCNQNVLRGSSCVTPEGHGRSTYRNFFYATQSWQFTGLRLARTLPSS